MKDDLTKKVFRRLQVGKLADESTVPPLECLGPPGKVVTSSQRRGKLPKNTGTVGRKYRYGGQSDPNNYGEDLTNLPANVKL